MPVIASLERVFVEKQQEQGLPPHHQSKICVFGNLVLLPVRIDFCLVHLAPTSILSEIRHGKPGPFAFFPLCFLPPWYTQPTDKTPPLDSLFHVLYSQPNPHPPPRVIASAPRTSPRG